MNNRGKKLFIGLSILLSLTWLVGSALADNLVINGDFELGNTGFSSQYTFSANNVTGASTYTVGSNPNDFHGAWSSFAAESGSEMMIINGATSTPVKTVWYEDNIPVAQNANYDFSGWYRASYSGSPATLDIYINNVKLTSLTVSSTSAWTQFLIPWSSGTNNLANLDIKDTNTDSGGNDFCLDNIQLNGPPAAAPLPASIILFGSSLAGLGLLRLRKRS